MNSKYGLWLGIWLLSVTLLLLTGYFLRCTPVKTSNGIEFALPPTQERLVPRAQPKTDSDAILSHNLFHPQRGKVAADKEKKQPSALQKPQQRGQFSLVGIFQYQGTSGAVIRILNGTNAKKTHNGVYKVGDALGNGYHLLEIKEAQVVIGRNQERITLPLHKQPGEQK